MKYQVIAIYWNNDSNELHELPEVRVVTCGNDGMEVLGTSAAIQELHSAVLDHPDKFTLGDGPRPADEGDFQAAVDFSRGNWPEFNSIEEVEEFLQH